MQILSMIPTAMLLLGSSAVSGLLAIGLFVLMHKLNTNNETLAFFDNMSEGRLTHIANHIHEIRAVHFEKKQPILNYHTKLQKKISHVEIKHKDGKISKILPANEHEREALRNRLRTLESKLNYHKLPNIIKNN